MKDKPEYSEDTEMKAQQFKELKKEAWRPDSKSVKNIARRNQHDAEQKGKAIALH